MKTLLLTDIPPCRNLTAGLVTAQMCRALQPGELAAFVILNGELYPEPDPDLAWIPTVFFIKPNERGQTQLGKSELAAFVEETKTRLLKTSRLIEQAISFGLEQGVDQVWAILQGQTMVRVSRRVSRGLNVPLKTHIWDPLSWWHRAWGVDRVNRFLDNRELALTLRRSVVVASASPAMSRQIKSQFGTDSFPIIASVDEAVSHQPAVGFLRSDEFVIGMAGQFYAIEAWEALCDALQAHDWRIAGRKVFLRVMGGAAPPNEIPQQHLRYHGWLDQTEVIRVLARECDVLYCPYSFSKEMEEVSRLSFPSKIVIYLAAGRPIFFHGPAYSSPYSYLADNNAGTLCSDLGHADIQLALTRLALSPGLYSDLALAGRRAFLRDLTVDRQKELVHRFLGIERSVNQSVAVADVAKDRNVGSIRSRRRRPSRTPIGAKFDYWYYLQRVQDARTYPGGLLAHYQQIGWRDLLDPNDWFSTRFYLKAYSDVAEAGVEPFTHYLTLGWREGRSPNPWFSTKFYLEHNPELLETGQEPLEHYRTLGWRKGRDPSPLFSVKRYLKLNPDVEALGVEPLGHYFSQGWREGRDPAFWFVTGLYLRAHPEAADGSIDPLRHYLLHGWRERFDPNGWFSTGFYLETNPDVAAAGVEPITHYLTCGWREGRDPSEWFSTNYYLKHYPEIGEAGIEPCSHYFSCGWRENRNPNGWFSVSFYLKSNPDVAAAGLEPFGHYLSQGWRQYRDPNEWFSVWYYLTTNPEVAASGLEPVKHYRLFGEK